jgi:hypothetical protein
MRRLHSADLAVGPDIDLVEHQRVEARARRLVDGEIGLQDCVGAGRCKTDRAPRVAAVAVECGVVPADIFGAVSMSVSGP